MTRGNRWRQVRWNWQHTLSWWDRLMLVVFPMLLALIAAAMITHIGGLWAAAGVLAVFIAADSVAMAAHRR
jgi:hypothetical protein